MAFEPLRGAAPCVGTYPAVSLTRIFSGTFTLSLLPVTLAGLGGILVGKHLGVRVGDRLDADSMKKIIYVFVGISGVITLVQELF